MKKYLFLGLILILTGCQEANEIFDYDKYWELNPDGESIIVMDNGYEQYFEGPVYIDATSWGSMAYVSDRYVNKGLELLVSESSDAEGGKVFEVKSNQIAVNDLVVNKQYYYCLSIPEKGVKSEIKKVVIPDVSALILSIEMREDSVICAIEDSISSSLIQEKGFKINGTHKYVVDGKNFALSIPEVVKRFSITESFIVYAYVQTANTFDQSSSIYVELDHSSTGTDTDSFNINTEDITMSDITEETIDDVDYLKCTITGYVDEVYFTQGWHDNYSQIKPDMVVTNDEGTVSTFYIKKGLYSGIYCKANYKLYWSDYEYYDTCYKESNSYTPTQFNVRTLDEFQEIVLNQRGFDNSYTITLLADITLPADVRLSMDLEYVTLDGNGHTLDGISYFPFFRNIYQTTIKNLKIGTDNTVYAVKKGTYSGSTANSTTPRYLLTEESLSYYATLENCEIRGTIQVYGREDFSLSPDYSNYWSEEDEAAGTFEDHIVRVTGLKDYTKIEFK